MNNDGWTVVTEKKKKPAGPKKITPTVGPTSYAATGSSGTTSSYRKPASGHKSGGTDAEVVKKFTATNKHTHAAHTSGTSGGLDEEEKIQYIPHDVSLAIVQARQEKKLSQEELAKAINEKVTVVREYEGGKAIGNNDVIARMEKALGTQLPRIPKKRKGGK